MAKNEPNMPDDAKIMLENEQTTSFSEIQVPEMTAEEAAIFAH